MTVTPNAATTEGSTLKAQAVPLPSAMPRKANPLHQQVLGALIETKPVSWTHKTDTTPGEKEPTIVKRKITGQVLRFPLAQNVSEPNVDRIARRWIK